MRKTAIILILAFASSMQVFAYKNVKAILVANRLTQKDSIGYNIVNDLAFWTYENLDSQQIVLWDSPQKKYKLKFNDLQGIEKTSGMSFTNLTNVFIYETWNLNGHDFKFEIKGFSFTGESKGGDEVNYGYLEFSTPLKKLLSNTILKVNANGNYGMTIWQGLMNMQFDYDLVFFNEGPINFQQNLKIKQKVNHAGNKNLNLQHIENKKLIEYAIETGPSLKSKRSAEIISAMENFFNENPQEFFNYGGDNILSFMKNAPVILSQLNAIEIWERKDNNISFVPQAVIPYVFGITLQPIPVQQWDNWKIKFNDSTLNQVLTKKDFYYIIKKINFTEVREADCLKFAEALQKADWTGIIEYVKKEN